jgi:hypothetical protein
VTSSRLWAYTLILVAIGVAAVIHRLLTHAPGASEPARFDLGFAQHAALTAAHIVPGPLFVVLGPLQFMPALRASSSTASLDRPVRRELPNWP